MQKVAQSVHVALLSIRGCVKPKLVFKIEKQFIDKQTFTLLQK